MVAFLLVYSLSWKGGLSPLRIILVGVAVNAMFTGLMSAFNSGTGSSYSGAASIVNANITQKTWDDFGTLVVYVVVGIIASFFVCGRCNLLALEDKTARSLGVNVTPFPYSNIGNRCTSCFYQYCSYRSYQLSRTYRSPYRTTSCRQRPQGACSLFSSAWCFHAAFSRYDRQNNSRSL